MILYSFQAFIRSMSERFYNHFRLGEDSSIPIDGMYERHGRELAIKLACNAGNALCLAHTYTQTSLHALAVRLIPNGLEDAIFCSGLRGDNRPTEYWVALWHQMQLTSNVTLKSQIVNALGCSDDKVALKDFLESSLGSENGVKYTQSDRRNVLVAVLNSHSGFEVALNFIKNFELDIMNLYGFDLQELLSVPARTIKTLAHQSAFLSFLTEINHLEAEAFRSIVNIVSRNLKLQEESPHLEIIQKILDGQVNTSIATSTEASTAADGNTSPDGAEEATPTQGASSVRVQIALLIGSLWTALVLKY